MHSQAILRFTLFYAFFTEKKGNVMISGENTHPSRHFLASVTTKSASF